MMLYEKAVSFIEYFKQTASAESLFFRMEFLGLKFKNPPGSNLCYSNACVNGLLASQTLMSKVNHDHGSIYQGQNCGICFFFSYYKHLNLFQSNEPDSTEALKNHIAQKAK